MSTSKLLLWTPLTDHSETQGEKAYKSGEPRSRTTSIVSDGLTPPMKVNTPQPTIAGPSESSPSESVTPRMSNMNENQMRSSQSFNSSPGNFQAGNYGASPNSHKRPRTLPDGHLSPRSAPSRSGSGQFDPSSSNQFTNSSSQAVFDELYEAPNSNYAYTTTAQLPILHIPEEILMPGLTHTHENSPWCSPASSNCSTQSEGSRSATYWTPREERQNSTTAIPDWPAPMAVPQWSNTLTSTPQDLRGPGFSDSILDQYNDVSYPASSRMGTPGPRPLLEVPNAGGYYHEETAVGTPTLPTYSKPFTQSFSAASPRFSDHRLEHDGRKKTLVGSPSVGNLNINTVITYSTQQQNLDIYIDAYFQHFHRFFPIIHRPTFDQNDDYLLSCAMASIGTQYHATIEARTKGSELNESCRKSIDLVSNLPFEHLFVNDQLLTP